MKMTMDDHQQDINDPRVLGTWLEGTKTMKINKDEKMTMTDTKVKETIARVQKCGGAMTSDQLRKMSKEICGEDGRDEVYKDEGAGLSGMVEGGGVGRVDAVKGEGASRGQDTGDIKGCYSYPLVDPRLEVAPDIDHSTVVQCTGADRSIVQPLDMMDNPLYSQHLEDKECDDEQDADDLGARQGDERDDERDVINTRDDVYKGDRSKDNRIKGKRKNGNRNRDDRLKDGDRNKEWPGTREGVKVRDIRYIKEEDIGNTSDKDREKKQNQAKANGSARGTGPATRARRTRIEMMRGTMTRTARS